MKETANRIRECFRLDALLPPPVVFLETDSTNLKARALAEEGAMHGTTVIALVQSAGRGRFQRRFESDIGGLYMSVILRDIPTKYATRLTPYAAVCAARAIEALCPCVEIKLKWINDLYLNGRKLAGILTESALSADGKTLTYAIVGIGINLTNKLDETLQGMAISLDEVTNPPDIGLLARHITSYLTDAPRAVSSGSFMEEYRHRCFLIGQRITVHAETVYEATVLSIGEDATLTVSTDCGEIRTLSAGEVSVRL